ncbi:MAG: hypothetical protein AAF291_01235 [Pseudomonadota bacterium]
MAMLVSLPSLMVAMSMAFLFINSHASAPPDRSIEEVLRLLRDGKPVCAFDSDAQVLSYIGATEGDAIECFDRYRDADVRTLRVTSNGGFVRPAIAAARIIREEKWAVEAFGLCASSCMNYWAPAGSSFTSTQGTTLLVHGAPSEEDSFLIPNDVRDHQNFVRSLKLLDEWFGNTRAADANIATGIGEPVSPILLVGPCHAQLISHVVPTKVWWPSSSSELRKFIDGLPVNVRLKACELDGLTE